MTQRQMTYRIQVRPSFESPRSGESANLLGSRLLLSDRGCFVLLLQESPRSLKAVERSVCRSLPPSFVRSLAGH